MTIPKPAKRSTKDTIAKTRKSFPITLSKNNNNSNAVSSRRATVDPLDVRFDYIPMMPNSDETSSSSIDRLQNNDSDDLQQLLSAIHKRYKANEQNQEKHFKEVIRQTVKKSTSEFQTHMEKFSNTMEERLTKLRQELNGLYLERQNQLDKIYEQYEEFKLAMQETIQKVEERDTGFRNAVAQYFEDTKGIKQEYKLDIKEIEDLVERASITTQKLKRA